MSIENILKRIEEETAAAVGEIISEAESEAEKIREDHAAEAGELKVKLERQARTKAEEEQRRLLVNEELRLRKEVLERKREILDALYAEAQCSIDCLFHGPAESNTPLELLGYIFSNQLRVCFRPTNFLDVDGAVDHLKVLGHNENRRRCRDTTG